MAPKTREDIFLEKLSDLLKANRAGQTMGEPQLGARRSSRDGKSVGAGKSVGDGQSVGDGRPDAPIRSTNRDTQRIGG